jgi:transcriptional regulator with XRE-family HTH domain
MNRRVERDILDMWIDQNKPSAVAKLALESGISASTIEKVRLGYVPPKKSTRRRLYECIGVSENELFPILPDGEEQAS